VSTNDFTTELIDLEDVIIANIKKLLLQSLSASLSKGELSLVPVALHRQIKFMTTELHILKIFLF